MKLTGAKLRAVLNMLSDEKQSHAAAHIISKAAQDAKTLVADFISENLGLNEPQRDFDNGSAFDPSRGFYCSVVIIRDTDRAWLLSRNIMEEGSIWIPKSQAHVVKAEGDRVYRFWISFWIARQKDIMDWRE
jgi:hypothetical protein